MTVVLYITFFSAIALSIYLLVALLKPEIFS